MDEIRRLLEELGVPDEQKLNELIDYCNTRVYEDEGIPTFMGLDDLVNTGDPVYTPAKQDQNSGALLGVTGMLLTERYNRRPPKEAEDEASRSDTSALPVAFAISALSELFFRFETEEDGKTAVYPYGDAVGVFKNGEEDGDGKVGG